MGLRELAEDRAKEREKVRQKKKREKERRNRRTYKYGQTEVKYARRGMMSCALAFLSTFFMVLIFSVSYISRGEVNVLVGFAGLMALFLAVTGLLRGIEGLKERNKNYTPCKIGIACNTILVLMFVATFIRGLF